MAFLAPDARILGRQLVVICNIHPGLGHADVAIPPARLSLQVGDTIINHQPLLHSYTDDEQASACISLSNRFGALKSWVSQLV